MPPEYLCSVCGYANDPLDYAMRQIGKRYYHLLCIDRVVAHAVMNFDIKMDEKLRIIKFERKED